MNVGEFKREGVFFTDADISEIVKAGSMYAIYFEPEQGYTSIMVDKYAMKDFNTSDVQDVYCLRVHKNIYFITGDSDWLHLYCVDRRKNKMSVYIMSKDDAGWSLMG